MKLADYMVTEAGFGADLGAENSDIVCRYGDLPCCRSAGGHGKSLKNHGEYLRASWEKEYGRPGPGY